MVTIDPYLYCLDFPKYWKKWCIFVLIILWISTMCCISSNLASMKKHSTPMALSVLVDRIISTIYKDGYFMSLFLGFSKAFDTVNHQMLMNKLDKYVFGVLKIHGKIVIWPTVNNSSDAMIIFQQLEQFYIGFRRGQSWDPFCL